MFSRILVLNTLSAYRFSIFVQISVVEPGEENASEFKRGIDTPADFIDNIVKHGETFHRKSLGSQRNVKTVGSHKRVGGDNAERRRTVYYYVVIFAIAVFNG